MATLNEAQLVEALRFITYTQLVYPEQFAIEHARFTKTLAQKRISAQLGNAQFQEALDEFTTRLQGIAKTPETATIDSTVPETIIAPVVKKLVADEKKKGEEKPFTEKLTASFFQKLKEQTKVDIAESQKTETEQTLKPRLPRIIEDAQSPTEALRTAKREIQETFSKNETLRATDPRVVNQALEGALEDTKEEIIDTWRAPHVVTAAIETQALDKGIFIDTYTWLSRQSPDATGPSLALQAERLTQVEMALSVNPNQAKELIKQDPATFLVMVSQNNLQKAAAPLFGALLARLPENVREAAFASVLSQSFEKTLGDIQQTFGANIVNSQAFQKLRASQFSIAQQKNALQSALTAPQKILTDVVTTVFSGENQIAHYYLELAQKQSETITPTYGLSHFITAHYAFSPETHFSFLSDIGQWALRLGSRKALGETGKAAVTTVAGTGLKGFLTTVFGTAVGGPVGAAASWLAGTVGTKILGGIGKVLTGEWLAWLFSGGAQQKWQKDGGLLIAGGAILFIIFLFIFPSFLNLPHLQQLRRDMALVTSRKIENGPELETSSFFSVTKTANKTVLSNTDLPADITFAITVKATTDQLINLEIANNTTVTTKDGTTTIHKDKSGASIDSITPPTSVLNPGASTSVQYTVTVTQPDALIFDSVVVTADVPNQKKQGEASSANAKATIGTAPSGKTFSCKDTGNSVIAPGATTNLLIGPGRTGYCIRPNMIVIHWSAGVVQGGNQATYNTLVSRGLSCQFATDPNGVMQMQQLWEKKVELAYCVGGYYNNGALNNELAGVWLDTTPPPEEEIRRAIDNTCFLMRTYNISASQIYGHFQLNKQKSDPGAGFLQTFIARVKSQCTGTGQ